MFDSLEDKDLLDSYKKAVALKLEKEFILLLEKALVKRGLLKQRLTEE